MFAERRVLTPSPAFPDRAMAPDLCQAIQAGQFRMAWQPIVNCGTGELYGFEALLRWDRPGHGPVSPAVFVPVAELMGLHRELDGWAMRTACAEAARWPRPLRVAVNVSAGWFQGDELSVMVEDCLHDSGLDPSRLEIEVTERVFIESSGRAQSELGYLKALGVSLSLDDFGTGFSAMSYLRNISFDKIKLDRMFVEGLGSCRRTEAIVRAMLHMGAGLGMVVCAEGVEQESQLGILQAYRCNEVQGYLIGRPDTLSPALFSSYARLDQSDMFMDGARPGSLRAWVSP